ncbi:MAG: GAF domain-containing protein, partial [Chloroflexi bacterium]
MSNQLESPIQKTAVRYSLRSQLFVTLVLVALISATLLAYAAFRTEREALKVQVINQLNSVADLKTEQIEIWLREREADARLLADNRLNEEHLTEILLPDTPPERKAEFISFLRDNLNSLQQSRTGYTEVILVDVNGKVIIATDESLEGKPTPHLDVLEKTKHAANGAYTADIHRDPRSGRNVMAFSHLMYAVDPETLQPTPNMIGAVIIVVDMEETVYPLIRAWPGMGDTGETLLVRNEGDETVFLNNLRFDEDAALNLRIPVNSPNALPAHLASRGAEGIIETADYRGVPVLAAFRHIDPIGWGFVAKEDLEEAFAPVTALAYRIAALTAVVLAGVGGLALALSRWLLRPIEELVAAAQQVAVGNLNIPIQSNRSDELGILAHAFSQMVAALRLRRHQTEALSDILRLLNATSEINEVVPSILMTLQAIFECADVNLALLDESGEWFEVVGLDDQAIGASNMVRVRVEETVGGTAVATGNSQIIPDLTQATTSHEIRLAEQGFRSCIIHPLRVGQQTIGTLNMSWLCPDGFSPDSTTMLEQVASAIAFAIERGRLFGQIAHRIDELQTINEISYVLRSANSLTDMLPATLEKAIHIVGGVYGAIFLVEQESGQLVRRATFPPLPSMKQTTSVRHQLNEGISGHVVTTGQIHIATNLLKDPYLKLMPGEKHQLTDVRSSISIPLRTQDKIVGVLHIGLPAPHHFTSDEIRMLTTIAEIAGNAINRALLLETLEQRVAERTQELAKANERLQELDRLKSKFVSEVSHELRTPVTNLRLYLDLLARTDDAEKQARYHKVLQSQVERLGQLIEDILDLSRLEMGRHYIELLPTDLNEIVQAVFDAHMPRAEQAGLHFTFTPASDLPPILGERNQLAQVVTNLIANAINYTLNGFVRVLTLYDPDRQMVGLCVQDSGIGIAADDLPHLFDRFYRGERSQQFN